jgi:hypothetical protein
VQQLDRYARETPNKSEQKVVGLILLRCDKRDAPMEVSNREAPDRFNEVGLARAGWTVDQYGAMPLLKDRVEDVAGHVLGGQELEACCHEQDSN